MKIMLSGASGLIGTKLQTRLDPNLYEFVPLTRKKKAPGIYWNPKEIYIDHESLESIDGVIHLAGENIASTPWTAEQKAKIYRSRVDSTRLLVDTFESLLHPPKFFLTASAVGYYGDHGSDFVTETSDPGANFLAHLCRDWEEEAKRAKDCKIRCIQMRLGLVLSTKGGALQKMLPSFRYGFGAKLDSGQQYLSWIDLNDCIDAIEFLIKTNTLDEAVNLCSPNPIPQKEFAKLLARHLHRPCWLRVPRSLVEFGFGQMGEELFLTSTRTLPKKLLDAGFAFQYETLEKSLSYQLGEE